MCSLTLDLVLARTKGKDLDSVTKLNCWGCSLNDVSLLKEMRNIEILILSANELSTMKDIQFCQNLKELYIRNNHLKDLNEIFYLKYLKNLKILWLADDESVLVKNYPNYRSTVLKNLPSLVKLDNKEVTNDEIQDSIILGEYIDKPINIQETEFMVKNSDQNSICHEIFNKNGICNTQIHENLNQNLTEISLNNIEFNKNEKNMSSKVLDQSENSSIDENNVSLNSINLELKELKINEANLDEEKKKITITSRQVSMNSQTNQDASNILSAILLLVKDLNSENLQTVIEACQERKNMLESVNFYS